MLEKEHENLFLSKAVNYDRKVFYPPVIVPNSNYIFVTLAINSKARRILWFMQLKNKLLWSAHICGLSGNRIVAHPVRNARNKDNWMDRMITIIIFRIHHTYTCMCSLLLFFLYLLYNFYTCSMPTYGY